MTLWASRTTTSCEVTALDSRASRGFSMFKDFRGRMSEVMMKKISSKKMTSTRGVRSIRLVVVWSLVLNVSIALPFAYKEVHNLGRGCLHL